MQAVTDLDEDHADVLGHGHKHLTQVLTLLLLFGGPGHSGQFGHALHQVGHRQAEPFGYVGVGGLGVLDGVVEQGGDHRVHIQTQVGHDLGHGKGMDDIGLTAFAQLTMVLGIGIGEGVVKTLGVQIWGIGSYFIFQSLITFQDRIHKITLISLQ